MNSSMQTGVALAALLGLLMTAIARDAHAGPWTVDMGLASSVWSGGAADCTAKLTDVSGCLNFQTITFHANP